MRNIRTLSSLAMLVALEVILSRFCSIATPFVKIGFAFLPVALMGRRFGAIPAAIGAAAADLIGATLFPIGAYFPGFTATALLTGATYGLCLHGAATWPRILAAVTITTVCLNLLLNSYWLSLTTGQTMLMLLPTRLVKCLLMAPIEVLLIRLTVNARVLAR